MRDRSRGWTPGVCAAVAAHLGVSRRSVRWTFVLLTLAGGAGLAAYVFLWALTPEGDVAADPLSAPGSGTAPERRQWAVVLVVGGLLVVGGAVLLTPVLGGGVIGSVLVPLFTIAIGAIVAWSNLDDAQRSRWLGSGEGRYGWMRVALGAGLTVAGILVLVTRGESVSAVWDALLAAIAVLVGVLIVAAPWALRLWGDLRREQVAAARATERADIAAHLHDSVLQTLALIQRQSHDAAAVTRLARAQERELRSWLYSTGPQSSQSTLAAAVTEVAHDVEDLQGVAIDLVVTGDRAVRAARRRAGAGDARGAAQRGAARRHPRHGLRRDRAERGGGLRARPRRRLRPRERAGRPARGAPVHPRADGAARGYGAGAAPRRRNRGGAPAATDRRRNVMSQPTTTGGGTSPGPVRVVLVDDHRMFRTGVRAELTEAMAASGVPVCEFVGEAPDVDTAISVIRAEQPDVVLLDVHLPGGSGNGGVDVIHGCFGVQARTGAPVRFLALSVSDAAEDVIAVIRAGARGYVTKTIGARDLITAIRRVADGDAVFSPRLAGFVLDAFGAAAGEIAEVDEELDRLSAARARGDAAHRARLPVQGGGQGAVHLGEDRRDPRVLGAAQAAALLAPRAHGVGDGSPPPLRRRDPRVCSWNSWCTCSSSSTCSAWPRSSAARCSSRAAP